MTDDEKAALADAYERAADYLEIWGWIQGDLEDDRGSVCFVGALDEVAGDIRMLAADFAANALELPHNCPSNSRSGTCKCCQPIVDWNDAEGRTADEVINTLHALANKLR